MPNLFPSSDYEDNADTVVAENVDYKGSYRFDFDKGEFVKNIDGTIAKCNDLEAYKQWCQMAVLTDWGKFVYNSFGQEFSELKDSEYSQEAIELEVKRMTIEALMVNKRTKDVTDFNFTWQDDGKLFFEYIVITTDGETIPLSNSVDVG